MIPVGYLYKRVAARPDWLKAETVLDIYSLSGCISENFADYINYWKHNGYWLFDTPQVIEALAANQNIALSGTTLFYYEAYEFEFDESSSVWAAFRPEPSFVTEVQVPGDKQLEGFDVTTFNVHTSPECSPLSCNALATTIPVNPHCLFPTFAEAKESVERGLFKDTEPGPYRIFAIYTVNDSAKRGAAG